jgi:beta-glucosidase
VATSAYQIEGGRHAGGKGESIWDRFSDMGRLSDPGDVACDHYHRWDEDLDLLGDLGVSAYRFSVAWTRILPDGVGDVSQDGLDFYRRLVEGMLERGIRPLLTLYHWDLPQALQDHGGWANRDTAYAFANYARVVAENFGDVVHDWLTQNEPWVASMLGHQTGVFAPGLTDWNTALRAGHHLILSHGLGAAAIRDVAPDSRVGIALDCRPASPASDRDEDVLATQHFDGFRNRWFFDPIFGHGYPDDMVRAYTDRGRLPEGINSFVEESDLAVISQPNDFLGLNYYTTIKVAAGNEESEDQHVETGPNVPDGYTEMGWLIDPDGFERYLGHIDDQYSPASILITENGASYSDGPDETGRINDARRVEYIRRHIAAVDRARQSGIPVDGYFVWSLLDNIEWVEGFSQRFGLVWVNQLTGERLPKESFNWYRRVVAGRPEDMGEILDLSSD